MDNKVKVTVEYEHGGELVKEVMETDFAICMVDSEHNGESTLRTMILGKTKPLNLIMASAQLQENVKEVVMGVLNNGKYQN